MTLYDVPPMWQTTKQAKIATRKDPAFSTLAGARSTTQRLMSSSRPNLVMCSSVTDVTLFYL
jgi:hypothetical protein